MAINEKLEERAFILQCIKLYESLPALWNTKCKDYSDRDLKRQQYDILLRKYQRRYVKADKVELCKKFNSLRTNFRKELRKKMRDSKEGVYKSTLWYFDNMKFLIKIFEHESAQNGMSADKGGNEIQAAELREFAPSLKKKKINNPTDELIRLVTNRLKASEDSTYYLGIAWGIKLSKMDRNQRIIAEKIINEVIFKGELGLLNFNTSLTNIRSVRNLNTVSSSSKKNNDINKSEALSDSTTTNNHAKTTINVSRQNFPTDIISYSSPSSVSRESSTDLENESSEQNFIVEEYDPLDNSIKMED